MAKEIYQLHAFNFLMVGLTQWSNTQLLVHILYTRCTNNGKHNRDVPQILDKQLPDKRDLRKSIFYSHLKDINQEGQKSCVNITV